MAFQPNFPPNAPGSADLPHTAGSSNTLPLMNPWMPCSMPWTMENPPQLVRFGEQNPSESDAWSIPRPKLRYCKRKSDLDFNPKPQKMHITEEKMAIQLKNMHISNKYFGEQNFGDSLEKSDCLLPTLHLSKEVQNLTQSFQEPLLPESLFPKPERSTRALVLWKPPGGSITSQIISNLRNAEEEEEEVDSVNNNSVTPDLNAMTTQDFSSSSTEMELS